MTDFADYAWLTGDEGSHWLRSVAQDQRPALQLLSALRKDLPAERAAAIVEQTELRRRAAEKFGRLAASMFFTPTLLEQSSDLWISRYKAQRLRSGYGPALVHDFCCGIGGDLMGLAEWGFARGWDRSELARHLAEANLRSRIGAVTLAESEVRTADATEISPAAKERWHVDPDRRANGRRTTAATQMAPGADVIERWLRTSPSGVVKLAPATESPEPWKQQGEREWISSRRECRQQVVWFGELATVPGHSRATTVRGGGADDMESPGSRPATFVGTANAVCEVVRRPGRFIMDADPAVHAARLLGAIAAARGLSRLGTSGGYLTGDAPSDDPLLACFAVEAVTPLRIRDVAAALVAARIGRVELKKRGVDVDLEKLRQKLKLRGDEPGAVIITRIGEHRAAIIGRRVPAGVVNGTEGVNAGVGGE